MNKHWKIFSHSIIICLVSICVMFLLLLMNEVSYGNQGDHSEGEIYFTLLHTNDEHSALIPHSPAVDYSFYQENPTIGGYARLSTLIKEIRKDRTGTSEEVILVSAGDFIGGTAFSWLALDGHGVELRIKQKLGYDAVVIGNHEYDYGTDVLASYLQAAGYPEAHDITAVLATNIKIEEDHPMALHNLYKEYHIIELTEGIKIGFFGLIGEDAINVAALTEPVVFKDQKETAKKAIEHFKNEKVDIIVAITHSGVEEDMALAKEVDGIDIIVGGHCHTTLIEPVIEGDTIIVQTGAHLKHLGFLEIAYEPETKKLRLRNESNDQPYLIPVDSSIREDEEILDLISHYTDILNQLIYRLTEGEFNDIMDTVATSDFSLRRTPPMQESPFGNFIADAMRLITWEKTGKRVDVAIQANGSIRGDLVPGAMEYSRGLLSLYDITTLISLGVGKDNEPGYPITSFYLTGEEIYRALEVAALLAELMGDTFFLQFSGLRYDYNLRDAVLLTIPVMNMPIPSTRAVKKVQLYTGDSVQPVNSDKYIDLKRGDDTLYHIVADSYILSFLPMAGELLPQLSIEPKNSKGNPILLDDFDQLIVYDGARELKVWQTVVQYAASQLPGDDGVPKISNYYRDISGRINVISTIPLITWPILIAIIAVALVLFLIVKRRRKQGDGSFAS